MLEDIYKEFWQEAHFPAILLVQFVILCLPFIRPKWILNKQLRPLLALHGLNVIVAAGAMPLSLTTAHFPQSTPYLVVAQFFSFVFSFFILQYRKLPESVTIFTHAVCIAYSLPLAWVIAVKVITQTT